MVSWKINIIVVKFITARNFQSQYFIPFKMKNESYLDSIWKIAKEKIYKL